MRKKVPKGWALLGYRRGSAGKPNLATIPENNNRKNYYVTLTKNSRGHVKATVSNKTTPNNAINTALNYGFSNNFKKNQTAIVRLFKSPRGDSWRLVH